MIVLLFACVPEPTVEGCDVCEGLCVETYAPATHRDHVDGEVAYPSYPPSSGDHDACWIDWGVHPDPVPTENWVHNLEHGGVVFLYTSAFTEVEALTAAVAALPEGRAVLTPASEDFDGVVAAVAWQNSLLLGCYEEATLLAFFSANVGHAPEDSTAGPNPTCTTGDTGG